MEITGGALRNLRFPWQHGHAWVRGMRAGLLWGLTVAAYAGANAADFPHTFTREGDAYRLTLQQNSVMYFGIQYSEDLILPFETIHMGLGTPGPVFEYTPAPGETHGFFRIEGISVYAPKDSDRDGMDDIWEIQNGLDPLDAVDAFSPSARVPGLTNLEEYRLRFGLGNAKPQFYSREVSLINFGSALTAAVSREISLFNFGAQFHTVEAYSREVSLFNGDLPPIPGYPQIYSREISLFNFGSPRAFGEVITTEVISREVSIFNRERDGDLPPIPGYPQVYSREVSVFNFGASFHTIEVISREVSVLNDIPE